jgi:hypothetical protein
VVSQHPIVAGVASASEEHRVTVDPKISQERNSANVAAGIDSSVRPAASLVTVESEPAKREAIRPTLLDLWLHRVTVLLFVFVCAVVGVLLVILPWRPEWTDNRLLLTYPWLRAIVTNGFFRGICSGLGMLDIWIGFWEATHYHEGERR